MEELAKEILKYLGNLHTKVEKKQGFMGNYYSPLIDTIYIAEDLKNVKVQNGSENINKKAAELIMMCHECAHSVQSKGLHLLNTLFANLSMILSVICILIALLGTSKLWLIMVTSAALIASITIRLILEVGAINGSAKLAKEVVDNEFVQGVSHEGVQEGIEYIKKHKLFALVQMILDKIVFLILVLITI